LVDTKNVVCIEDWVALSEDEGGKHDDDHEQLWDVIDSIEAH